MAYTDISKAHDWINFIVNKGFGLYFTPVEIDNALHRGQMWYFDRQYAEYAETEQLQDSLAPFKATYAFTTANTPSGVIAAPAGYGYLLGGQITVVDAGQTRQRPLRIVEEDELPDLLNAQVAVVSTNKPIATMAGQGVIQLYPQVPMAGKIFYLSIPQPPVYAYTQTGRTITYNPAGSTQMLWNEYDMDNIMNKALFYLGINLTEDTLIKIMDEKDDKPNT